MLRRGFAVGRSRRTPWQNIEIITQIFGGNQQKISKMANTSLRFCHIGI
jgi:hypothetical protein